MLDNFDFYPYGYLLLSALGAALLLLGLFICQKIKKNDSSVPDFKSEKNISPSVYSEWDGLPEEFVQWGSLAVSKIVSFEKRHEAAKMLRNKIDTLWINHDNINSKNIIDKVLKELGDANLVAEELKETYRIKDNPQKDRKIGIAMLILSIVFGIYPFLAFFAFPSTTPAPVENANMTFRAGSGAGAGGFIALIFFFLGIWNLCQSAKTKKQ